MISGRLSISFKKLDFETSNVSVEIIHNHHMLSLHKYNNFID